MPFTAINVVNGTTPVNATWGNNAQIQFAQAVNSFEQDLYTPFVYSGLVCTRDVTTHNQLDVTSGIAFLVQTSATNELYRIAPAASTPGQFTTVTINTTYYLFLKNDGTWQWSTTSTGPANSLAICQATTDGSGNILVVTDVRGTTTTLLSGMAGMLKLPTGVWLGPGGAASIASTGAAYYNPGQNALGIAAAQTGVAQGIYFAAWNGSASIIPFSVGGQFAAAPTWVETDGTLKLSAGAASSVAGVASLYYSTANSAVALASPLAGGAARGIYTAVWDGASTFIPFSLGGQFGGASTWVSKTGAVGAVAGVATAGSYGVPPVIASAKDLAVAVNTQVTVCSATTPNDGHNHLVRFGGGVTVGAGATNNGTCNFNFNYPDPNLGTSSQVSPYWNGTNVVGFSAVTIVKGGLGQNTQPTEYLCGPNATVSVSYQNSAAGTISDKVSGIIELLT